MRSSVVCAKVPEEKRSNVAMETIIVFIVPPFIGTESVSWIKRLIEDLSHPLIPLTSSLSPACAKPRLGGTKAGEREKGEGRSS
jgi:hypothetical protein